MAAGSDGEQSMRKISLFDIFDSVDYIRVVDDVLEEKPFYVSLCDYEDFSFLSDEELNDLPKNELADIDDIDTLRRLRAENLTAEQFKFVKYENLKSDVDRM